MIQFCYDCAKQSTEDNGEICKSFDEIIETFEINKDNFYDNKRADFVPKTVWGKIQHSSLVKDGKQLIKEYFVFPNQLKKMLREAGYPNPVTELKVWRDKGVLNCDSNHLTNKVKFRIKDKDITRMYVIQVWQSVTSKKPSNSQLSNLLIDDEAEITEKEETNDGNVDSTRDCEDTQDFIPQGS